MVEIFAPTLTPTTLEMRYRFRASQEKLFHAWTDPTILGKWFHVTPDQHTPIAEVDLRVGGRYRLGMQAPGEELLVAGGEYRLIEEPSKLVFTWRWEAAPQDSPSTLVTIEFQQLSGGTELILRHESFETEEQRDNHLAGWQGCVTQLTSNLEE
jgi:uncharacterized protein YndB with AHSA1/START domain